jgi:hypothetical protein
MYNLMPNERPVSFELLYFRFLSDSYIFSYSFLTISQRSYMHILYVPVSMQKLKDFHSYNSHNKQQLFP